MHTLHKASALVAHCCITEKANIHLIIPFPQLAARRLFVNVPIPLQYRRVGTNGECVANKTP